MSAPDSDLDDLIGFLSDKRAEVRTLFSLSCADCHSVEQTIDMARPDG